MLNIKRAVTSGGKAKTLAKGRGRSQISNYFVPNVREVKDTTNTTHKKAKAKKKRKDSW